MNCTPHCTPEQHQLPARVIKCNSVCNWFCFCHLKISFWHSLKTVILHLCLVNHPNAFVFVYFMYFFFVVLIRWVLTFILYFIQRRRTPSSVSDLSYYALKFALSEHFNKSVSVENKLNPIQLNWIQLSSIGKLKFPCKRLLVLLFLWTWSRPTE